MKKIVTIIILIFVALAVCLFLFRNMIAKVAVSSSVKALTGLKLSMKDMNLGIKNTFIGINEMKLYNPPGFTDRLMVDMPHIYVDYDLPAILKGNIHLKELRIDLKEFRVVRNKNGALNIDSLKVVKESKKEEKPQAVKEKSKKTTFKIDVLNLKIGKVIYKDYSKGEEPAVKEYKVNINEKYENITDLKDLGRLIIIQALMNSNLDKILNFNLHSLEDITINTIQGLKDETKETVKGLEDKAAKTIKNILPLGE